VPIEETWAAILELVAEGKVRHGGISNHHPEEVERALAVGPVAALQYEYSVLARGVEEAILPLALARGLGVIVWAPLASGFLTDGFSVELLHEDDFRRGHHFAQLELEPVRSALRAGRRTAAQGAIGFVLSHPAVTGAIVGVRNQQEGIELAQMAELRLTRDEAVAIASTV
jgi:aryl-alcohol dehydrogenase-like predicted oxidoreductase